MLIKCPECGKEISDKAKQCIHCGYPLEEYRSQSEKSDDENIFVESTDTSRILTKFYFALTPDGKPGYREPDSNVVIPFNSNTPRDIINLYNLVKKDKDCYTMKADLTINRAAHFDDDWNHEYLFNDEEINTIYNGSEDDWQEIIKNISKKAKVSKDHAHQLLKAIKRWKFVPSDFYTTDFKETEPRQPNNTLEQKSIPKCPTCQSTKIKKIGSGERAASILTWGLFSKKIQKTFKCENCGYMW